MAAVYLAHDPTFGRNVAVKILPPQFARDPKLKVRFEQEAKTIATLDHTYIAPVYDYGEEEGQPYLVMRYLPGGTLVERMANGALTLQDIATILTRLARALDAAHRQGVIHRDLKPSNVLFDAEGNVFLSDFGISKLLMASSTTYTGSGVMGTPAYMSPEQVSEDKTIDQRTDVYSLGVILYELLTGHHPYQSETLIGLMYKHVHSPVPQIDKAPGGNVAGWNNILARALAKNPNARYASAAEMAEAVNALVAQSERHLLVATTHVHDAPTQTLAVPTGLPATAHRATELRWLRSGAVVLSGVVILVLSGFMWFGPGGINAMPTVTGTPTLTQPPTATLTITRTSTPTPSATATASSTTTATFSPTPTRTPSATATSTATATRTRVPPTPRPRVTTPPPDVILTSIQLTALALPQSTGSPDVTALPPTDPPSPVNTEPPPPPPNTAPPSPIPPTNTVPPPVTNTTVPPTLTRVPPTATTAPPTSTTAPTVPPSTPTPVSFPSPTAIVPPLINTLGPYPVYLP